MEILLFILGYFTIGVITGLFMTKLEYANSIKTNEDPLPKNEVSKEKKQKLEVKRRERLAKKATRSGIIAIPFWPVLYAIMILSLPFVVYVALVKKIAIDPEDAALITEIENDKAMKIVEQYQQQEKEKFQKELDNHNA